MSAPVWASGPPGPATRASASMTRRRGPPGPRPRPARSPAAATGEPTRGGASPRPGAPPIPEAAPLRPITPYGETKRTFEGALRFYGEAYGLRSVSLRYFNVAGATERNGELHDPETHLIPNVLRAAETGVAITLFGDD